MSPKIIDKQAKRNHILKAAIRTFARLGFPNTRMIHIAEAAGIGKGTIYEYFKSKEDLFIATFQVFVKETGKHIERKISKVTNPEEKLRHYFQVWVDVMDSEFLELSDIMLDIWAEGLRVHSGKDIFNLKDMYRNYRIQLAEILEEGIRQKQFKPVNTTITASIIVGTLDGLMIQWIMDRNIYHFKEAIEQLTSIIIDGLTEGNKGSL